MAVAVAGANRPDFKLARETLEGLVVERPLRTAEAEPGMCLDKGYDYAEIDALLEEYGFAPHVRRRGEGIRALDPDQEPRRWVVERTHSWLNRFRGLLIRWCKKADNYLGQLELACALICLQQAGLLG